MSIQKTLRIYIYIVIFMLIGTSCTVFYMWNQFSILEDSKNNQRILLSLAVELQESSHSLTNFAREYVITGKELYKKQYFNVLKERSGLKERSADHEVAAGKKVNLSTLLYQYGVTAEEEDLFLTAQTLSDLLTEEEIKAMNMVQGLFKDKEGEYTLRKEPDYEGACKIIFSHVYQLNKARILRIAQEFSRTLLVRTNADVAVANRNFKNAIIYVSIFIVIIFISVLYSSWYAVKKISKPLLLTMEFEKKIDNKKFSCNIEIQNSDEITQLSKILNILAINIKEYTERLEMLSYCDDLTGVWNRRKLFLLLKERLCAVNRNGGTLAFSILDIDHFKNINDTYGHDAGDVVLRCFVKSLSKILRKNDIFARFGGEEFVLYFEKTTQDEAEAFLNRVRKHCEAMDIQYGEYHLSITVSIGAYFYERKNYETVAMTTDTLLKRADDALYLGKNKGRNCVVFWGATDQSQKQPEC